MDLRKFGERLAKLREIKGVSAREMSLSIGLSENYINKIENGKSLPSLGVFFEICDYLEISQKDFFDEDTTDPSQVKELITDYKMIDGSVQSSIAKLIKGIAENSK